MYFPPHRIHRWWFNGVCAAIMVLQCLMHNTFSLKSTEQNYYKNLALEIKRYKRFKYPVDDVSLESIDDFVCRYCPSDVDIAPLTSVLWRQYLSSDVNRLNTTASILSLWRQYCLSDVDIAPLTSVLPLWRLYYPSDVNTVHLTSTRPLWRQYYPSDVDLLMDDVSWDVYWRCPRLLSNRINASISKEDDSFTFKFWLMIYC